MLPTATKDDSVHNLRNSARDAAADAKGELRDAANKVGSKVRSFVEDAKDELSHSTEVVTTHIHEKPVQSALIALGVGVVLGALLRR